MNQAGVQADVLPPSRLQYLRSFSPSPYNLSSILSIIPGSQFLNRLMKGSVLNLSNMDEAWQGEASRLEKVQQYEIIAFPGPWGFLTSGYMVGLIITAILLNRIQNVVIPRTRHRTSFPTATTTLRERLRAAILPLDFSRTATRFVFHLPSVCFLSKMLVIWIVLVLQTCQVPLVFGDDQKGVIQGHFEKLARWAMDKEMSHICWSTFCSVCGAFVIEGFIKAMDGLGGGGLPLGGGVNGLSPFHLVSYAFLLHVYSSPVAHVFHPADDSPSRPEKHVVIIIAIALVQLSIFHVLSISRRLSKHRLIPTAISSLLSLAHFHGTIFSHFTNLSTTRTATRSPNNYMADGATYPLLNYVPNMFETALLGTIFLTVTVNAVAQLLVRGRVDHVLSGLGIFSGLPNDDGIHNGFFANLPYEEDFIIVLMRIGVASLEATGLRGWNNEVAPIQRPKITPRRVWASKSRLEFGDSVERNTYGQVRMGRMGVAQVQYGTTCVARTSATAWRGYKDYEIKKRAPGWRPVLHSMRLRRGFNNDVRIIDLGHAGSSGLFSGPWNRNIVAFWQFLVVLGGVIRGLVGLLLDRARRDVGDSRRGKRKSRRAVEERDVEDEDEDTGEEADNEVYQRFLRGEDISDDEDEDAMEGSLSISDEEMSEDDDDVDEERGSEVVDLFTDLLQSPVVQDDNRTVFGSNSEMALAHLLHGTSRPLTRRVWNTLTERGYLDSDNNYNPSLGEGQEALEMRYYRGAEEKDREKGLEHICVVCMLESREIICWPCRCLAMCDGCRGRLAMRVSASKHRCPCCRQIVDGFSKIYIP